MDAAQLQPSFDIGQSHIQVVGMLCQMTCQIPPMLATILSAEMVVIGHGVVRARVGNIAPHRQEINRPSGVLMNPPH